MLRQSLSSWVGSAVTGEVTLELRRGDDYDDPRHRLGERDVPPRAALDGAWRTPPSARSTGSAADDAHPRHRGLARKLALYGRLGLTAGDESLGELAPGE